MVTKQEIHALLKRANIKENDTVLIHTSMRKIGQVENGCDGVIDGFISYLKDGLFLVPTHTWDIFNAENPVYDVRNSLTCIGALPNTATKRADGVRSMHPTHSMTAFGKRAKEYLQGEENAQTPCPVGGAWARLFEEDATVLLLGVGLERNTYIHAVDEMLDIENRLAENAKTITVIHEDGRETKVKFRGHKSAISEFFPNFKEALETLGALSYDQLGNATVGIFKVRKGTEIIKTIYQNSTFDPCDGVKELPKSWWK
jgi:aminoglycoside 3-N-acetyltransferase